MPFCLKSPKCATIRKHIILHFPPHFQPSIYVHDDVDDIIEAVEANDTVVNQNKLCYTYLAPSASGKRAAYVICIIFMHFKNQSHLKIC